MFEIFKCREELVKMLKIIKSLFCVMSCDIGKGGGLFGRKKRSGSLEYKFFFDNVIENVIVFVII